MRNQINGPNLHSYGLLLMSDPLLTHYRDLAVRKVRWSNGTDPLLTHCPKKREFGAIYENQNQKSRTDKSKPCRQLSLKAGDRIPTDDVQFGNSTVRLQATGCKGFMCGFLPQIEVYKSAISQ